MIEAMANRVAEYVAGNDETADREVIAYGAGLLIMAVVNYSLVLASALLLGVLREMLAAIGAFILMRSTIGGCHANNRVTCFITYSGIMYLSILMASFVTLSWSAALALYTANMALIILYAPGDTAEQPMVRNLLTRKIFGMVFLSGLFALPAFFGEFQSEINILLFVATWTCVLLHQLVYKAYGCKRSRDK